MSLDKTIALLSPVPNAKGISFYQQWFAEAWHQAGGHIVRRRNIIPRSVCTVLGRSWPGIKIFRRKGQLIVPSSGRVESAAWPALLTHEIIPMLWDLWPQNIDPLARFSKRHGIRTIFCTSSQAAEALKSHLSGVAVVWIPEGIKVASYPCGPMLKDRPVDILSYGRQMFDVIRELNTLTERKGLKVLFRNGNQHLFSNFEQLINGLQKSKVTICYPKSASDPTNAGGIETLTQRYWEAMLTGTLPAGHAPLELIEVCGYNPVVELGDSPCEKIDEVLSNIADYQKLADRNRKCAEEIAGWDKRMPLIMEAIR